MDVLRAAVGHNSLLLHFIGWDKELCEIKYDKVEPKMAREMFHAEGLCQK